MRHEKINSFFFQFSYKELNLQIQLNHAFLQKPFKYFKMNKYQAYDAFHYNLNKKFYLSNHLVQNMALWWPTIFYSPFRLNDFEYKKTWFGQTLNIINLSHLSWVIFSYQGILSKVPQYGSCQFLKHFNNIQTEHNN